MTADTVRDNLAEAALKYIEDGQIVGLGTGKASESFVLKLAKYVRSGINIIGVASSRKTEQLAIDEKITVVSIEKVSRIDIYIDGADEVDNDKRMIKGAGGALLREKILASISKKRIILIEEKKYVPKLGKHFLPVEIFPFGPNFIKKQLEKFGVAKFRVADNELFVTDNGNFIFDLYFPHTRDNPELDDQRIKQIPGVVETGFFFNLADIVLVGTNTAVKTI